MAITDEDNNLSPENTSPTSSATRFSTINYNHPLYLQPTDTPDKSKLGFVDERYPKSKFESELHDQWKKVNAVVLSWIMNAVRAGLLSSVVYASNAYKVWEDLKERFDKVNGSRVLHLHREIHTLTQGTMTVADYFSKLRDLWDEFDALMPCPGCPCPESKKYTAHFKYHRLLQFLMGLNDSYSQARSKIMMMSPVPNINKAYSLPVDLESQRILENFTQVVQVAEVPEGTAMFSNRGPVAARRNPRPRKKIPQCEYCHYKGHTKENYYKLIGYPSDFKSRKKGGSPGVYGNYASSTVGHVPGDACKFTNNNPQMLFGMQNQQSLQDLYSGQVKRIDKEELGLYILQGSSLQESSLPTQAKSSNNVVKAMIQLRYTWICLIVSKSDTMVMLRDFLNKVKNVFFSLVKTLRIENGGEFFSHEVKTLISDFGINHQSICVYTPQQNGIAERRHRTILNMARSLRFQATIPLRFEGECVTTVVYLINRLPSRVTANRSPFEMMHVVFQEDLFPFKHMKAAGTPIFPVLDPISLDAVHYRNENIHVPGPSTCSPETLAISHHPMETSTHFTDALEAEVEQAISEKVHPSSADSPVGPRRSSRPSKPPRWLQDYVTKGSKPSCSYPLSSYVTYAKLKPVYLQALLAYSALLEPKTFKKASSNLKWIQAMQLEIAALEVNNTWSIVDLPPGKVPIGCKWIFKIKYRALGEVEIFKARLVAKGYSQREGIDYTETFSQYPRW
nr:uncharacterized protein LOC104112894 [Nicotiana tomentosiformis]